MAGAHVLNPTIENPQPAPLWRRLAALFYDTLLVIALWFVTTGVYLMLQVAIFGEDELKQAAEAGLLIGDPLLSSLLFLSSFFFYAYFWRAIGQTLGMQAWKIRVQNPGGYRLRWLQCVLRYFGALVSFICLGLGYLWALWDPEKRTWHDRYSLSEVVLVPRDKKK